MSHLLDSNICSAHFRRPGGLAHRFIQYGGGLFVSTIVLGELYAGAYHVTDPTPLLDKITDLLNDVQVLDFDHECAKQFGRVRGSLLKHGISVPTADLMIAAVALVHDLTLATHNTADFRNVPGLRLDDWLKP
ncbi:MAG: type II toxin-antitoxin system VapC family toxin [Planctomycetaceae bacterium]|nr:MAG: type II toxin-antitoxin system VapC family toxin [Planctomycetaceae bacterium]